MRRAIPLLLLVAACSQPAKQGGPGGGPGGGIVSTNPCADAILVGLVPPERIAAISHYSHDPGSTSLPTDVARRFRATGGTAEEVIAMAPELVLTSSFTPAATRIAYAKAGLKTLVLDSPTTVEASERQVMQIAEAVDAIKRGRAMVGAIERSITVPPPESRSALLFIAGDLANGSGTLLDELMRRAGLRNAAAEYGLTFSGTIPVEMLAANPPDVIIASGDGRTADLRRRLLPNTPRVGFDRHLVNCGGPSIPSALARMRAIRAAL